MSKKFERLITIGRQLRGSRNTVKVTPTWKNAAKRSKVSRWKIFHSRHLRDNWSQLLLCPYSADGRMLTGNGRAFQERVGTRIAPRRARWYTPRRESLHLLNLEVNCSPLCITTVITRWILHSREHYSSVEYFHCSQRCRVYGRIFIPPKSRSSKRRCDFENWKFRLEARRVFLFFFLPLISPPNDLILILTSSWKFDKYGFQVSVFVQFSTINLA